MIIVKNKRCSTLKLEKEYPGCVIIDVTSKAIGEWQKFSPFYPHGGIPVPFTPGVTSMCVEGIWQGLKVFKTCDVDRASLRNDSMKNIKRTVRRFGSCIGHRKGMFGNELLNYIDARKSIYLPSYLWVLENKCALLVEKLKEMSSKQTVILLDYETNEDINDPSKPLSHASLIKKYIENEKF